MTLTEHLQAQLAARVASDPRMRTILRRILAGRAAFSDTALYTRYLGETLGALLADALPDAGPEDIRAAALTLLRDAHEDVNAQAAIVQEIEDRRLETSLVSRRPTFPAGRAEKVARSLMDTTVPVETRQRRARNAAANVVASYHDEFIKENAQLRSDAGFSCRIVRLGTSCCPWCAALTGSYPAGTHPPDLFRRHDNCTCTIIYETRRTRQTLRGKGKSWNVVEEVERKQPLRFSREEAKALQTAEMGRYQGLTKPGGGDIMRLEAESPFKNPKTPLNIDDVMQSKHIRGGKRYQDYMQSHEFEPSYLTISKEKAQELVDKFHGSGILKLDQAGKVLPNEIIIDNNEVVGVVVNNLTGAFQETTAFKIQYGSKGTHIVPTYENQKQYYLERRGQNGYDWLLRQKG